MKKIAGKLLTGFAGAALGIYAYGDYVGFWGSTVEREVFSGQIKVACVGDSITYGMTIKNRRDNCYPEILQQLLGDRYNVRNYGLNNRNAMKTGAMPYIKEKRYRESLEFKPDVVLLMMGTNDSKDGTWQGEEIWKNDYRNLVRSYLDTLTAPEVYLLTPPYPHKIRKDGSFGVTGTRMLPAAIEEECHAIRELSALLGLPVIDINHYTKRRPEWFSSDGVHLNNEGASRIAHIIAEEISGTVC